MQAQGADGDQQLWTGPGRAREVRVAALLVHARCLKRAGRLTSSAQMPEAASARVPLSFHVQAAIQGLSTLARLLLDCRSGHKHHLTAPVHWSLPLQPQAPCSKHPSRAPSDPLPVANGALIVCLHPSLAPPPRVIPSSRAILNKAGVLVLRQAITLFVSFHLAPVQLPRLAHEQCGRDCLCATEAKRTMSKSRAQRWWAAPTTKDSWITPQI
jgi:hypothetical protein